MADETFAAVFGAPVVRRAAEPPLIAVAGRERFHGLRRRIGASAVDDLIETVDCPVALA